MDVTQILRLYFEADRSEVERRYKGTFWNEEDAEADEETTPAPNEESVSTEEAEEEELEDEIDNLFINLLASDSPSVEMASGIWRQWNCLGEDRKIIGLHYLTAIYSEDFTLDHGSEGLVHIFGVHSCSMLLHALRPELFFPIDISLTFAKFSAILEKLGIEVVVDAKSTEYENWMAISNAIFDWAGKQNLNPWQTWAAVYDLGPRLLPPPPSYPVRETPRVWVVATNDSDGEFAIIDAHGEENVGAWAINKNAKRGDLALMYCVSPRSSLVSVYRVLEDSHFDPFGGWNGFRAEIGEKIAIPWISIGEMKRDSVFREWKLVKGNFQGLLHYEVPQEVWIQLVDRTRDADSVAGARLSALGKAAHGVRELRVSGETWSEKEVEDKIVLPLLERCGWKAETTIGRQVEMLIKVGSGKPQKVRADFVGYRKTLSSDACLVVEVKRRISSTKDLEFAALQAESYAGRLRCSKFAVASPEGIWVYKLEFPGISTQIASVDAVGGSIEGVAAQLMQWIGYDVCIAAGIS